MLGYSSKYDYSTEWELAMKTNNSHRLFTLCSTLLIATAALAQNGIDSRLATGFNAISAKNLRADLTFLASDALEGRMSLQRGSEIAIEFTAAEFAKAGLKPLVGESYLQPVELIEYLSAQRPISIRAA